MKQLLDNIALPKCCLYSQITCVIPKVTQHLFSFSLSLDPAGQHLRLLGLVGGHDEVGVGGAEQEGHNSHQGLQSWLNGAPHAHDLVINVVKKIWIKKM